MSNLLLQDALRATLVRGRGDVAIDQDDRQVSYDELAALVGRVTHVLAEARAGRASSSKGRLVGISSAVTVESIAAAVGALSAGFAYVPLDVQSPPERLRAIISDAKLEILFVDPVAYPAYREIALGTAVKALVLLDRPGAEEARPLPGVEVVAWSDVASRPPEVVPPPYPVLADDLAYVLYTSGSTGTPKGVMLTHRNARTFVDWMAKEFAITERDRVASRAPLNFDFSVFDIFDTLAAGARLLINDRRKGVEGKLTSEERHRRYVDMLRDKRASVLYATPSAFVAFLEKGGLDRTVPLRLGLYAGEPFPPPLLRRLMLALPEMKVANIYGPTETNIVTYHWVTSPPEGDAPIPIGREVDDTEIVVVEDGKEQPPGELGELWVRGGTVCIGYLGKDDLTRARLVDSPFHDYPVKFWRTGDYGKRLADGTLVYHGRIDNMVKTRGYRVELGDVETALSEHPKVAQAVVVPRPHPSYGSTLHAFVLPSEGGAEPAPAEVKDFVRKRLPEYMLPWEIVVVREYPYTSTGKVDRQRLIAQLAERGAT